MKTTLLFCLLLSLSTLNSFGGDQSPGTEMVGHLAPEFSAMNQTGKKISLKDYRGKFVVLYFYPKDDTSGCTQEALLFKDEYKEFKKNNAVILGVSRQDEKSHQDFRKKFDLPFDLLVDADGSLGEKFGVGLIPVMDLSKRESILIGPTGKILKVYRDVDPAVHAKEVLGDIKSFQKAPTQKSPTKDLPKNSAKSGQQ